MNSLGMDVPWAQQQAASVRRHLLRWWRVERRDLPWRLPPGHANPYATWISEVMLQQTQVATVIPYYTAFLARFPSLEALAESRVEDVLAAWSGLGYYARARALHRAAREALARFGGLPRSLESLRELPGFGPYTAGAVASIAFGVRTPAIDGNAGRVLARLLAVDAAPSSARFRVRVSAAASVLVRGTRRAGDLNQAIMELGALVCRPASPRCETCPLTADCEARRRGLEGAIPRARRRAARRTLTLSVGVCVVGDRVLLVRRPEPGLFAGMWGPPAVEVGAGDDPLAAIAHAVDREPSMRTGEFAFAGAILLPLTHRNLDLRVHVARGTHRPRSRAGVRWVSLGSLGHAAVPSAFRAALAMAVARLAVGEASNDPDAVRHTGDRGRGGIGFRRESR